MRKHFRTTAISTAPPQSAPRHRNQHRATAISTAPPPPPQQRQANSATKSAKIDFPHEGQQQEMGVQEQQQQQQQRPDGHKRHNLVAK